jgi:hypothetical protein
MTDLNNDGIPDNAQGFTSDGAPSSSSDTFSRILNDPGVRRGFRIGGRIAIGYSIFFAVFFLAVLAFIIYGATKALG